MHTFLLRPRPSSAKVAALLLVTGAALGIARPAAAQIYKVTAAGIITSASNSDTSVVVGTPYTFSFLFDYSAPDTYSVSTIGVYDLPNPYGASAAFGDYTFAPTNMGGNELAVYNGYSGLNGLTLSSYFDSATVSGSPAGEYEVTIEGLSSTGFVTSDAQLPLSAYNVANFDNLLFNVASPGGGPDALSVEGSVTSLSAELVSPAAVPEASTTVSLGVLLGLGGLTFVVRRRRMAGKSAGG